MIQPAPGSKAHPLQYVVPLYFMQSLPLFLVTDLSKIIFSSLGVGNQQVATYTALIGLPWSFKLLWGPIVELNSTRRTWIVATQAGIGLLIALFSLAVGLKDFLGICLAVLSVIALFSATCDIATDGFYLLATDRERQQIYVGWQSTMFRLGRLFLTGGVVWLSGELMKHMGKTQAWMAGIGLLAAVYLIGAVVNFFAMPRPEADVKRTASPEDLSTSLLQTGLILAACGFLYVGLAYGFGLVGDVLSYLPVFAKWRLAGSLPLYLFFVDVLGGGTMPSLQIHAIYAGLGLASGSILLAWAAKALNKTEIGEAFGAFFKQKDLFKILYFVLFYRFGEAMLGQVVPLFLLDRKTGAGDPTGGLGFSVADVGVVNGIFGVVGIVLGGIIGGMAVSKIGIRRGFWILAAAMNVPNLMYLWASLNFPSPQIMSGIMFFDQFGYGFGFAGYLICLQAIAQRTPKFTTAHYAIATGMGAFLIAGAGTLGGALMAAVDFPVIFTIVLFFTIPCLMTLWFFPLSETEGIVVHNTDMGD